MSDVQSAAEWPWDIPGPDDEGSGPVPARYYMYVLECDEGFVPDGAKEHLRVAADSGRREYVGSTSDLPRRIDQHIAGTGADFTRWFQPTRVLAIFGARDRNEALSLENEYARMAWSEYDPSERFVYQL